jgi:hypothetical protein
VNLAEAVSCWQEEMAAERRHWEVFQRFVAEETTDPVNAEFSREKLVNLAIRTKNADRSG